jgi:hypothetical protein
MLLITTLPELLLPKLFLFLKHCLSIQIFGKYAEIEHSSSGIINVQKLLNIDLVSVTDNISKTCK